MDPVITGALIGAGGNALSTAGGNLMSDYSGRRAAKRQYKYWRWGQFEGPSLRMQGLRKAGINPIHAAGGGSMGAGGAFAPGMSPPRISSPDVSGGAASGSEVMRKRKLYQAELKLLQTQTDREEATKRAQDELAGLYYNQSSAAHYESLIKSLEAYFRKRESDVYAIPGVGHVLPFLRAFNNVGVSLNSIFPRPRIKRRTR